MSLAGAAGGAAEGLKDYLLQMLREQQLEQQRLGTQETIRHNKATEEMNALQLLATQQAAQATRAAATQKQTADTANQSRDDQRAALDDLLPGVMITPQTRNAAVTSGAAVPERFGKFAFPQIMPSDFITEEAQKAAPPAPDAASFPEGAYPLVGQAKNQPSPANLQSAKMLVDGKLTDVMVDPTPGAKVRVQSLTGEDVTSRATPYVPPRAEPQGFQVIQSGDNYSRFNKATGQFEKNVNGQWVVDNDPRLATSQSTRSMQEGAQMIAPHVPELARLAEEMDKRGLFGPVMGRITALATKFGTTGSPEEVQQNAQLLADAIANDPTINSDRLAGQFATTLGLMTSGMGRVHGGARGGGSIQMINYLKSLLSGTSSLPLFLGRLDAMNSYLKTYAAGPGGAAAQTDGSGGSDAAILEEIRRQMSAGQQPPR